MCCVNPSLAILGNMSADAARRASHFAEHGYVVLPRVISPEEVTRANHVVRSYLAKSRFATVSVGNRTVTRSRLHRYSLHGHTFGGWLVVDFPAFARLSPLFDLVHSQPRLREVLAAVLGPHRALSRSEIYVDRWGAWHMDGSYHGLALYNGALMPRRTSRDLRKMCCPKPSKCRQCEQARVAWHTLPNKETQRIVTVGIYLEDHSVDSRGLFVVPGSHASASKFKRATRLPNKTAGAIAGGTRPPRPNQATLLHPAVGDMVLFDTRLLHRAQEQKYAQNFMNRKSRTFLSLTYGRNNAFSEAFDRAFRLRNTVTNNPGSTCHGASFDSGFASGCVVALAEADLASRPIDLHATPSLERRYPL